MPDVRVMVYIDGSNLHHSLQREFGKTNIHIGTLRERLCRGRQLVRSYYYAALLDQEKQGEQYKAQQKFLQAIKRLPYSEVRTRRLKYWNWPAERPREKGVDIYVTTDMLTHCFRNLFDVCVLVSGDTDYAIALQTIREEGKHVEIALFPPESSSQPLRNAADIVIDLDEEFLSYCWMR